MAETKVIVTHMGALAAKYGAGVAKVRKALDRLIAADASRGIASRLVALDDASHMRAFRTKPVRARDDYRGTKRAFDAIDRKLAPHYFLLVGGPDVVPMQPLANPAGVLVFGKEGDDDPDLPSDLPYACDIPF